MSEIKHIIKNWKDFYKDLDIPNTWENVSYSNDECPSFFYNNWLIFINVPNQKDKDTLRFFVMLDAQYGCGEADEDKSLSTNDFNEVIEFVNEEVRK